MKKYYIYILTAVLPILWGACNNGDDIDTKHSIFSTEPMEHNGFDEWLLANYTYPYNVDFKYRMQDIESDHKYNLVPADYDKSVALAKIIKHVYASIHTCLIILPWPRLSSMYGWRHILNLPDRLFFGLMCQKLFT